MLLMRSLLIMKAVRKRLSGQRQRTETKSSSSSLIVHTRRLATSLAILAQLFAEERQIIAIVPYFIAPMLSHVL